jgi:multiple sugar transport system ATP-binding protein
MVAIRFDHVSKAYADGRRAVDDLTLDIADGEFLVLVGPSGCGKSTALRLIAGLEDITVGQLSLGGAVANGLSPRQRNVAMIFQSYALYPHLSVAQNLGFALRVRNTPPQDVERRVGEAAATLELTSLLARRPGQLSGGQRQRVAMGRALVRNPNAFLMDEPLSNLDARLRGQMRVEIARLQRAAGVTTVYVTHDQVEAMTMGDRVAVMRGGVLQQLGSPRALYDSPVNLFVAAFMGSPPISLLTGVVRGEGDSPVVELLGARLALPLQPGVLRYCDGEVIVGVRAEAVGLTEAGRGDLDGIVAFQEDLGSSVLATVDLAPNDGQPLVEDLAESDIPKIARRVKANLQGRGLTVGAPVGVRLDARRLLVFDPVTKLTIK